MSEGRGERGNGCQLVGEKQTAQPAPSVLSRANRVSHVPAGPPRTISIIDKSSTTALLDASDVGSLLTTSKAGFVDPSNTGRRPRWVGTMCGMMNESILGSSSYSRLLLIAARALHIAWHLFLLLSPLTL